jgi:hypothetical protein
MFSLQPAPLVLAYYSMRQTWATSQLSSPSQKSSFFFSITDPLLGDAYIMWPV